MISLLRLRPPAVGLTVLLGLAVSGALAAKVSAQTPEPSDDEVNAVARHLYCPVCENVPLDVCPMPACEQWRQTIRAKLAEGWSEERIQRYFADQYGMRVLASPTGEDWSWLAYAVPPVAFLSGVWLLRRTLRSRSHAASRADPAPVSPEDLARVEAELRRRDA